MHFPLQKFVFFILLALSIAFFEEIAPVAKIAEHARIFAVELGFEWLWDEVFSHPAAAGPVAPPPVVPTANVAVTTDRIGTFVDEAGNVQGEGFLFDTNATQIA